MTNDITGATIDGAENVVVGKENRQQTGGYGDQNLTINHPHELSEAGTIRLIYELVSRLEGTIAMEGRLWRESLQELRTEVGVLRNIANDTRHQVNEISDGMAQAVTLTAAHRRAFYAGFVLLAAPIPLFFDGLRQLIDINWQLALSLSLVCYALSAGFWYYMWWGSAR